MIVECRYIPQAHSSEYAYGERKKQRLVQIPNFQTAFGIGL